MNKTILQVPLNQQLKQTAEEVALAEGFSSLQEVVRVFLSKFASHKIEVSLQENVLLSKVNEKRYVALTRDFKSQKNIYKADNVDELMLQLNEN